MLLLVAGHETTVSLISNAILALLRHPDQLAALRADPGLAAAAVEETLRYDAPVQFTARIARGAMQVGDVTALDGAVLMLLIAATGRDLEQAERDGQVRLRWEQTPIDLFFSVLPFHDEVEKNVRHVSFGDRTIPVLSCTALAVFKAMFDRPRDWVDIEAMVEARAVDLSEARRWVVEIVGEDARAEKLSTLSP